jgi:Na+/phosphate symporter
MQIHSKEIRKYLISPSHSYLEEEEVMIHQNIIIYLKKKRKN